jgi:hypothetical protein
MARYAISTQITLAAATAKTAIRVNTPASRKAILRRVIVTDKLAGSTDEGVRVRVMTAGTDGTGTGATPVPLNNAQACVATAKVNYTVEPTASPVEVWRNAVPAGAGIEWGFEGEDGIQVPHSGAVALELTATQARTTSVEVTMVFEE